MQSFAIIPAAGRSRRMGQPKLLLPWGDSTVIEHVLATWLASRVDACVVVLHPDDAALAEVCRAYGVLTIAPPNAPPEMKDSIGVGLKFVAESLQPGGDDAWLVAPADMPGLSPEIIDRLIEAHAQGLVKNDRRVRAPRYQGKQGHPVLFPWPLAGEVAQLNADEGLNALVARHEVDYLDVTEAAAPDDFDTPQEYDRQRPGPAR